MDTGIFTGNNTSWKNLPPIQQLPPRGTRALPPMPSQDTDEMPAPRGKKKKLRKGVEGAEDSEDPALEMGRLSQAGSRRASLSSRVTSEVREHLTPDVQDAPPQRRKKKKKAATIDLEEDQADMANGDGGEPNTDEDGTRKPKKKKKHKVAESANLNELGVEDDDIITDAQPPISQHSLFSVPLGQSQPVGKLFLERKKRFQAADRSERLKTTDPVDSFMDVQSMWTTKDVSMRVHSGFRVVGLFSHGFLAGYAVWNVVVMYILAGDQLSALPNLLKQYHSLAYPAQSLFYLLLAISTVSAFDRVNLARASTAMRGLITLDPIALASLLYFTALVLSLSQQMTSDRINLYPGTNETLWSPGSEHQILYPWIIVNLVVALLVGLAWMFISTRPELDYTEDFLMAMEVDTLKPEEKGEIKT